MELQLNVKEANVGLSDSNAGLGGFFNEERNGNGLKENAGLLTSAAPSRR